MVNPLEQYRYLLEDNRNLWAVPYPELQAMAKTLRAAGLFNARCNWLKSELIHNLGRALVDLDLALNPKELSGNEAQPTLEEEEDSIYQKLKASIALAGWETINHVYISSKSGEWCVANTFSGEVQCCSFDPSDIENWIASLND